MDVETGAMITAVVAAVYGVGFAIWPSVLGDRWGGVERHYTMFGALLVLVCAVALIVVPWLSGRS